MSSRESDTSSLSEGNPPSPSASSSSAVKNSISVASEPSAFSADSSKGETTSTAVFDATGQAADSAADVATSAVGGPTNEAGASSSTPSSNRATTTSALESSNGGGGNATSQVSFTPGSLAASPSSVSLSPEPQPTDTGAVFNSTVAITVNATSPMIDLSLWRIDPNTGYRYYTDRSSGVNSFHFVGVGYTLNGWARPRSTSPTADRLITWTRLFTLGRDVFRSVGATAATPSLGEMKDLNLTAYYGKLTWGSNANLTFTNATFYLPVRTQAANFSAMKSQAKTVPVLSGNNSSPFMDVTGHTRETRLEMEDFFRRNGEGINEFGAVPTYYEVNGTMVLSKNAELVYSLPFNTTLVEVLGPTGTNAEWSEDCVCFAYLNPRPSWWLPSNFPISSALRKGINATDQTLFLLPIDPSIAFELHVGGLRMNSTCPVSAIRTYPFHYDFSANIANATTSDSNSESSASKTRKTPIIIGVVVGIGAGLILLGFAFWLFRRHRKKQVEREKDLIPEPFTNVTGEPRTKAELERMARGEDPHGGPTTAPMDEGSLTEPRRQRGHRVVQEEDGESFVEYLPPQYRDAWNGGGDPGPSTSMRMRGDPSPSSDPEVLPTGRRSPVAPIQDPELEDKVRGLNADRPQLKQEYTRAFSRALPHPPHTASSSDSGVAIQQPPSADAQGVAMGNLQAEYKRRFGLRSPEAEGGTPSPDRMQPERLGPDVADNLDGSPGQGSSSQANDNLQTEYKRWFS